MYKSPVEYYSSEPDRLEHLAVAVLNEAGIKDERILFLLQKYLNMDYRKAVTLLGDEKNCTAPCRDICQYLILEKSYDESEAKIFVHNYVESELSSDSKLSRLSPAELFDTICKKKNILQK